MADKPDDDAYKQGTYVPPREEVMAPPHAKVAAVGTGVNELLRYFNDVSRTLRVLEERYINLRRKTQVTDQNMLSINRNLAREIKTIISEIGELRRGLEELNQNVKLIQKDLGTCAIASELNTVKKYLGFWEPLNFVTEQEVRAIVKNILNQK